MTARDLRLFPGCAMDGTGREYGRSALAVLEALGRPVQVLDDWNCCGATAVRGIAPRTSVRLAARNLALAAGSGCDVLVACAACYNNLAHSRRYLQTHPDVWPEETSADDAPRPESAAVHHLLTVLAEADLQDRLGSQVVRPLEDMRLACYYGCLLVRPGSYTDVDDPENPTVLERLMGLCGAETVDWSHKTDCCGGSSAVTDREAMGRLVTRLFESALARNVTGLVVACPLCHMNLDAWQPMVAEALGRPVGLPVYYFTELMALALGLPGVEKWLAGHLTEARPVARNCR